MTGSAVKIIHDGLVAALAERLDHAQPLGRLLAANLGRHLHLVAQLEGQLVEIDLLRHVVVDGLGAHAGLEDARRHDIGQLAVLGLGQGFALATMSAA